MYEYKLHFIGGLSFIVKSKLNTKKFLKEIEESKTFVAKPSNNIWFLKHLVVIENLTPDLNNDRSN